MLQTLVIFCWVILDTAVLASLAILVSFFSRTGNPVHRVARIWAKLILVGARIKVTVEGLGHIDPQKSYIFMSNHQSNFDIPVLLSCLPVQFRWLAKAELFRIPIFGRSMRGAGYISIDRSDRRSAFRSLQQAARKIKNGVSVMVFPEGTRSADGRIQAFKKGGFILAIDAGVPIVPIVIHGTHEIMPKGRLYIRPGRQVRVTIRPPVDTSGHSRAARNELLEQVRAIICEAYEQGKGANGDA